MRESVGIESFDEVDLGELFCEFCVRPAMRGSEDPLQLGHGDTLHAFAEMNRFDVRSRLCLVIWFLGASRLRFGGRVPGGRDNWRQLPGPGVGDFGWCSLCRCLCSVVWLGRWWRDR